jgi:hypothetical protein
MKRRFRKRCSPARRSRCAGGTGISHPVKSDRGAYGSILSGINERKDAPEIAPSAVLVPSITPSLANYSKVPRFQSDSVTTLLLRLRDNSIIAEYGGFGGCPWCDGRQTTKPGKPDSRRLGLVRMKGLKSPWQQPSRRSLSIWVLVRYVIAISWSIRNF